MNAHRQIPSGRDSSPHGVEADCAGPLMVVDLEADLLRNSLKSEAFLASLSKRSGSGPGAGWLDPAALAYDPAVLERIASWRADGGRCALYAECDETAGLAIALHLGQFDMVLATGNDRHKGAARADWIAVAAGSNDFTTFSGQPARTGFSPWIKALRPHQWLKNALVFVPLVAAHRLEPAAILAACLAFAAFSAIASGVYVLNDLLDLAPDRAHPRKRNRPFASGAVPLVHGGWMAAALLAAGGGIAALIGPAFLAAMAAYFVLTTAYSLHLKRVMVIDICILGLLYTLRVVAGGLATGVPLSVWLLAFCLFFFFSLAAVKRQAELVDNAARRELAPSGRGYHVDDLPIISMMAIGAGYVSVLVMALYVNSPDVLQLYPRPAFLWGICCLLLFWITRTVMLAHRGLMHDDPVVYAARDLTSLACGAAVLACVVLGTFP